jgi:hypothetical protein
VVKDACMTSETRSAASFGQESVVIARFDSYRRAERMAASPGREFGRKARKGGAIAVVVRGSPDGSLMVTEPRVLSAGDVASGLMPVSLARIAGFMSPFSMAKGARGGVCAAEGRGGGVGSGEHRAREILAGAGPHRPCWSAARTNRRTRWSPRPRPTAPDMDGMARSRSFSPSLILVALTIGCPPLPVSRGRQAGHADGTQPAQETPPLAAAWSQALVRRSGIFNLGQCRWCSIFPVRPRTPVKCNPNHRLGKSVALQRG